MIYLYTTEPDEGCREVETGIYGRPVHTYEKKPLKAKGWTETANELREEGREEKEVSDDEREAWAELYEEKFGKRPHHKAKVETIRQKLEEPDD